MPITAQHLAGIEDTFGELAAFRRTATRLHPRRGGPSVDGSSVGGPLLWPAAEEWPVCRGPHEEFGDVLYPTEIGFRRRPWEGVPAWSEADDSATDFHPDLPVSLLPIAQLRRADVPDFIGPDDADLAQVLWCPFDHDSDDGYAPTVHVRWRRAAEVTDPIPAAAQDPILACECYVPVPCTVQPEQVVEYEYGHLLPGDLRHRIEAWEKETGIDYGWGRSITKGWKVGGFASWNLSDPMDMVCACGTNLRLLLRVDPWEWDGDKLWLPDDADKVPNDPTGVMIGRGYSLWIWICPTDDNHPVRTSMQ